VPFPICPRDTLPAALTALIEDFALGGFSRPDSVWKDAREVRFADPGTVYVDVEINGPEPSASIAIRGLTTESNYYTDYGT
jgi:hypothetical protein